MSKPLKIKLSIPEPCSEDWDKMALVEQGRFCQRCSNIIRDFSTFTDKELVEFISKSTEKVCGRFEDIQLNRVIAIPESSHNPIFQKLLLTTALATGIAGTTNSKASTSNHPTRNNTVVDANKNTGAEKQTTGNITRQITGTVVDSSNQKPLPYSNLALIYNGRQIAETVADGDGNFTFALRKNYSGKRLAISIASYGYADKTIKFKAGKFPLHLPPIMMDFKFADNIVSYSPLIPNRTFVTGALPIDSEVIHQRATETKKTKKHKKWLFF